MPVVMVERLLRLPVGTLYISGGGEPLLHQGLVVLLDRPGVVGALNLVLITNGLLLSKISPTVLDRFEYIQVALPAPTEDLYETITGYRRLKEVLAIPSYVKEKCHKPNPQLTAVCVISRRNAHGVIGVLRLAQECGFNYMRFRLANDYEQGSDNSLGPIDRNFLCELADSVAGIVQPGFTNLRELSHSTPTTGYTPSSRCHSLDLRLIANVAPTGFVYCCVPDIGNESYCIGNLHEQRFEDIWNGHKHLDIIEELQRRYQNGGCSMKCRCHTYNTHFDAVLPHLPDCPPYPRPSI